MKINRKAGTIIALSVFVSLLIAGLVINHQAARKKGKDSFFDFEVPSK